MEKVKLFLFLYLFSISFISISQTIAAGIYHSLAVCSDGSARGWGYNGEGELGNGSFGNIETSSVQVSGLSNVVAIAAGAWHSLALKSNKTLWAWGGNHTGQLGNATTVDSHIPIQVS